MMLCSSLGVDDMYRINPIGFEMWVLLWSSPGSSEFVNLPPSYTFSLLLPQFFFSLFFSNHISQFLSLDIASILDLHKIPRALGFLVF